MAALLEVRGLCKTFGALAVNQLVDLTVEANQIHALIGPNGAGKTTFLAQLAGDIRPDAGTILFDGTDITGLPAHRRAHLGIARSYQVARLFPDSTVHDNVALAVQACSRWARSVGRAAAGIGELNEPVAALLERVELAHRSRIPAGILAHGERRKLELAMALASRPRLLLLDEPLAGMGVEESQATVALLDRLRRDAAILLVEHDVQAVFALADRMSVLVFGKVLASGDPPTVRRNPEVQRAYLATSGEVPPC